MKRILIIERFSDPSRNCDPVSVTGGTSFDVVHLRSKPASPEASPWQNLRREAARRSALPIRCLGAVASIAADPGLSWAEKRGLIASALCTGGAKMAALAQLPRILRTLRSSQFDGIECFGTRGFPLVPYLGRCFSLAYREFLDAGTRYFGEFAFELLAVVPYAYWLHQQGRLKFTQSSADTKCLYYFSPNHQELVGRRSYVPITEYPNGVSSVLRFDAHAFPKQLDTSRWTPPPYRRVYGNNQFRFSKELCVICNKYTPEPSVFLNRAVNYIPVTDLLRLVGELTKRYQVVYLRPLPADIVNDHQPIRPFGDFEALRLHFPDVLTIQQLHARHPEMTFNELQMKLFACCERFVSVLGGASYLASYFGGTNIVLARSGWEVDCDAYRNWFGLFSGARVLRAAAAKELHQLARKEFIA
jgi:hypothetical protein